MVTGPDLRLARESADISLERIAELTGRDKGHLSRVERGERRITPALIRDYQTALRVTVAATEVTPLGASDGATVDDMRRRQVLALAAAASVGAAAGSAGLLAALDLVDERLPSKVGIAEVQAVEAAADLYTRMDLAHGGGMASAMALSSLRWATRLFRCEMSDAIRSRLSSAVGLLADRLGWALYDSGRPDSARDLLAFALDTAAQGGDRDLRAHVMLDFSTVIVDSGDPHGGVEVLRMALGDERISSAERANLHAVCARHCGSAGDRQSGLRHVALAEEALAREDHAIAPDWARRITVSAGHHDSALGLALFALGDDPGARRHLSSALNSLDPGRTRTGLRCRTRLAVLELRSGDSRAAEFHARHAVGEATEVQSKRVSADISMMLTHVREHGLGRLADELGQLRA